MLRLASCLLLICHGISQISFAFWLLLVTPGLRSFLLVVYPTLSLKCIAQDSHQLHPHFPE